MKRRNETPRFMLPWVVLALAVPALWQTSAVSADVRCTWELLEAEEYRLRHLLERGTAAEFWQAVRTSPLRLAGCDDGCAAELFDDVITVGLVKYWDHLQVLHRGDFVMRHLQGDSDARDVLALSTSRCPADLLDLCRRIRTAAEAGVNEGVDRDFALLDTPAAQPPFVCEPGEGISVEYCELERRGLLAVREGRFKEAITTIERALTLSHSEIPNYELTGYLALAYCGSGDGSRAVELLRDFECMMAVDSGELRCYAGSEEAPARASGLTDRCFEIMCGETYLPYYESSTRETLDEIARLRRQAAAIREACEP